MKYSPALLLLLVYVLLIGLCLLVAGCAEVRLQPPSASVPRAVAEAHAARLAAAIGGHYWAVHGVSMRPFLSEMAVVVTEPADFDALRPGDVVVYSTRRLCPTVHRLRELRGGAWIVQGDAEVYPDGERVTRTNFLGRQCAVFFSQP